MAVAGRIVRPSRTQNPAYSPARLPLRGPRSGNLLARDPCVESGAWVLDPVPGPVRTGPRGYASGHENSHEYRACGWRRRGLTWCRRPPSWDIRVVLSPCPARSEAASASYFPDGPVEWRSALKVVGARSEIVIGSWPTSRPRASDAPSHALEWASDTELPDLSEGRLRGDCGCGLRPRRSLPRLPRDAPTAVAVIMQVGWGNAARGAAPSGCSQGATPCFGHPSQPEDGRQLVVISSSSNCSSRLLSPRKLFTEASSLR